MKLDMKAKLAAKLRRFEAAEQALIEAATAEQQSCKHRLCWEVAFKSNQFMGSSNPRRICVHCRYEEEGSIWSGGALWSRKDYGTPILAKSLIVETLPSDVFYTKRLPTPVPDWHPAAILKRAKFQEELMERKRCAERAVI
jgi:hypothetical protein